MFASNATVPSQAWGAGRASTRTTILLVTHDIQEAIFLSANPGRLKTILDLEFKKDADLKSKEDLIALPGYLECEQEITALMRFEAKYPDEDY